MALGEGEGNWMVYSPDGVEFFQTRALAEEAAERFLDDYCLMDADEEDERGFIAAQEVRVCKVVARAEVDAAARDINMVPIPESFLIQH